MADNFYLDTSNMDSVISQVQSLAVKTEELHADFQTMLTNTTQDWTGRARTTSAISGWRYTAFPSRVTQP